MRLKQTAARKHAGASDVLIAALLRGPGTVPPTGAPPESINEARWDLLFKGEGHLWRQYEAQARQRAHEWGWLPEAGGYLGHSLEFWAEHIGRMFASHDGAGTR